MQFHSKIHGPYNIKYIVTSWWWAIASPKHVEVYWLNKLKINSASSWFHFTHLSGCKSTQHKIPYHLSTLLGISPKTFTEWHSPTNKPFFPSYIRSDTQHSMYTFLLPKFNAPDWQSSMIEPHILQIPLSVCSECVATPWRRRLGAVSLSWEWR
jgi:hypothetical protein